MDMRDVNKGAALSTRVEKPATLQSGTPRPILPQRPVEAANMSNELQSIAEVGTNDALVAAQAYGSAYVGTFENCRTAIVQAHTGKLNAESQQAAQRDYETTHGFDAQDFLARIRKNAG